MKIFEALFIKYLRVRLQCSLHLVAAKWTERYEFKKPFSGIDTQCVNGTQSHGDLLCSLSMETLNENLELWQN